MLVNISDGYDPHAAKAKSRIDDKQIFETLAREYLEVRSRDMRARSLEQCRLHLLTYFMPLHKLPLKKLDRATVAAELRTIARDRGPVAADRGRSSLSSFLAWSIGEGILETNVVIGTNRQSKGASRERVLTDAELVAIWNVLPNSDFGRILKLLTLTGQRRSEIADLRWAEIEADAISLPAARTKNGRAHVVPLSPQARGVLDEVPQRDGRQLVFGEGNGGYSGFAVAKIKLDEGSGVTGWVVHDLRRTAATRNGGSGDRAACRRIGFKPCWPSGGRERHLQQKHLRRGKARRARPVGHPHSDAACKGRRRERHDATEAWSGVGGVT